MAHTNIDAMAGIAGTVTIFGGAHDVLDLTAEEFKLEGNFASVDHALDVVARLVPSLTRDALAKLTLKQLGAVYGVAMGVVKDVENEFPNGSSPAPSTTVPG